MSRHADAHLSRRPSSVGLPSAGSDASPSVTTGLARGALSGAVATGVMTLAMTLLNGAPPWARRKSLPPRQITLRLAAEVDAHPEQWTESERRGATAASHLAYGIGAGAVYGAMAAHLPGTAMERGTAFGLTVWGVSYVGWLPAAGIRRPPTSQPFRVEALMIAAHIVYGMTLGLMHHRLTTRCQRGVSSLSAPS